MEKGFEWLHVAAHICYVWGWKIRGQCRGQFHKNSSSIWETHTSGLSSSLGGTSRRCKWACRSTGQWHRSGNSTVILGLQRDCRWVAKASHQISPCSTVPNRWAKPFLGWRHGGWRRWRVHCKSKQTQTFKRCSCLNIFVYSKLFPKKEHIFNRFK